MGAVDCILMLKNKYVVVQFELALFSSLKVHFSSKPGVWRYPFSFSTVRYQLSLKLFYLWKRDITRYYVS